MRDADVVVVGAGIVGLATARAVLLAHPDAHVVVLDKERGVGAHQSGHNSGVVHAGVYYRPGSAKAAFTATGRAALQRYCDTRGLPYEACGKLVVATDERELGRLAELERRATANGVRTVRLDASGIRRVEPEAAGVAALHVPETAVVDFGAVCRALAADVAAAGGEVRLGADVRTITRHGPGAVVRTTTASITTSVAVNCAGLHADRLAAVAAPRIVPFRGEYHELVPARRSLVRALVYPVPDPAFPFLGVHLTRGVDGHVHVGPNAVLALAREGYRWRDVVARDVADTLRYAGTWNVARRHWRTGLHEVHRSLRPRAFARAAARLVPAVSEADLVPAGAGVRAQAVAPDGALLDDFVLHEEPHAVHVLNAPSPAATASLAIGAHLAQLVTDRLPRR